LAWFPTTEALRLGQDSIMSAALLLAVFFNLKRKRDWMAGLFLALGLYKPQLVLPIAGALVIARRWSALAMFTITAVVLVGISLQMVGWQSAFDLLSVLKSMDSYSFIVRPAIMPNLRGFSYLLFDGSSFKAVSTVATFVISAGLYLFCLYLWRPKLEALESGIDLKFSLTMVTTVLISFHLYAHDLFLLTIPAVLFYRHISASNTLPNFSSLLDSKRFVRMGCIGCINALHHSKHRDMEASQFQLPDERHLKCSERKNSTVTAPQNTTSPHVHQQSENKLTAMKDHREMKLADLAEDFWLHKCLGNILKLTGKSSRSIDTDQTVRSLK
jgi:hypothetical protein